MFGGILDASEIILEVEPARLIPVKKIDKSHVHIVGPDALYRVVPVATVGRWIPANHDWNLSHGHDVKMSDRLQPGETVSVWAEKSGSAFVVSTIP
jgi:hypothetical protein